ncbi:MAG: S8 family serine peptidase, partial [candidate division Zixibacteria bacterium]|nr:S8 family serine peptidase [candidate division Zixibacteria bacterium]
IYEHKAVLYAEPNHIGAILCSEPNDSLWDDQWNLHTPDDDSIFGIGCPTARNHTYGDTSIKIAIIDLGIDYKHPDLGGSSGEFDFPNCKVAGGHDYDHFPEDDYPFNSNKNHGTACAGVAAAITNNIYGVAGVAGGWYPAEPDSDSCAYYGAKIYGMKIDLEHAAFSKIARVLKESADPDLYNCQIISNSWAKDQYNETLRGAVGYVYSTGANLVAAKIQSGKVEDFPIEVYPADYDYKWVTAVASYGLDGYLCQDNQYCSYSSNYGFGIDLLAPGYLIPTDDVDGDYWEDFLGTSAATPHVAGGIALLRSINDTLWNEDYEWMLKFSTFYPDSNFDEWTWCEEYGHGDLRISTAIERLDSLLTLSSQTATGGQFQDSSSTELYTFIGDIPWFLDSLEEHTFPVQRCSVTVDVTYPVSFDSLPYVWGGGHGSRGFSGANPNYMFGFSKVVDGTADESSCELFTYVYKCYDAATMQFVGWLPCMAESVSLNYKLWGIPSNSRRWDEVTAGFLVPEPSRIVGNHPNPFNSSTSIDFEINEKSIVELSVFDLLGREVKNLINKELSGGPHSIIWDSKNNSGQEVASGIYFCRLKVSGAVETRRLTLIR